MAKKKNIVKPVEIPPGISQTEINLFARVDYPLFSFKYLTEYSINSCRDGGFFLDFLLRLKKLSELGWKEIAKAGRHGFGMEKIPREIIKPDIPPQITPEVPLFAFRATGSNLPFVGFQEGRVFHIVFIETAFGDIYDHQ